MSSIASILGTNNASHTVSPDNFAQDFNAIGSALQSGDLPTAQSALATFQQYLQGTSQTSPGMAFGKDMAADIDFQGLTNSLSAGDISGAREAFDSLRSDIKSMQQGPVDYHRHRNFMWTSTPGLTANGTISPNAANKLNAAA